MVRVTSAVTALLLHGLPLHSAAAQSSSGFATTTRTGSTTGTGTGTGAGGSATLTATPSPTPVTLTVSTKAEGRNKTAPLLHGLFFEDINHSGDGGLYGELIRNRAFQGSGVTFGKIAGFTSDRIVSSENPVVPFGPTLDAWRAIGDVRISLDRLNPLSEALGTVMRVDVMENATGEVGVLNEGWWGIDVREQPYNASFYIKPSAPLNSNSNNVSSITLSLRSNLTSEVFGSTTVPLPRNLSTYAYTHLTSTLTPTSRAPNSNNTFALTLDGRSAAGQTFYVSLVSLFPPTYKNRRNGLRSDLAEVLADLRPRFLRFPGGNNLEGYSIDARWKWKNTIGPLIDRPGRVGDWGYYNTDGLGLLEFLEWCEDMEIEPLLSVYAGYSLDYENVNPANTVPKDQLRGFVGEALEELEYVLGGTDTKWGALRAEHGHPEPFDVKYVEIGNEDYLSDSYYWRWETFLTALQAKYPNITYIATQATESSPSNRNTTIPPGAMWDLHHYETPQYFKDNFNAFDNWNEISGYEGVTIFMGEYSVLSVDRVGGIDWSNLEGRFTYPSMTSAIGEAIFGLAMERNPDVVKFSSYAPLLQNFNSYEWTPNFIAFSANPDDTVLSTSYYQQQMFSTYKGTETLPVSNTGDFDPVWWHASIDGPSGISNGTSKIYVKLVNAATSSTTTTIRLDTPVATVNGTILHHDDQLAFNYLGNATAISPVKFALNDTAVANSSVKYELPGLSIVVLELK